MRSPRVGATLSTLWIVFLLNLLFHDIHDLFRPGMLEQMITGYVDGRQVTAGALLAGSILVEIPILMVVLCRVLPFAWNIGVNLAVAALALAGTAARPIHDLDDYWFTAVEFSVVAAVVIASLSALRASRSPLARSGSLSAPASASKD